MSRLKIRRIGRLNVPMNTGPELPALILLVALAITAGVGWVTAQVVGGGIVAFTAPVLILTWHTGWLILVNVETQFGHLPGVTEVEFCDGRVMCGRCGYVHDGDPFECNSCGGYIH